MESFARVMEQRRSGGGSSSRVSSSPASARAASKPAPEETRWLEGEGALAFAVAMTSSGSSRGSSLQSSRRASPFPSPGRSTTRNGQEQQQQRSLPSSMRASPLPFPQLALDLKRHCSLPPSRRMSPLPSPHSSQQAEQRQVPAHRHDQEERAATPTLSKNAVSLHRQRRPRALLRPLPRVIESASPSKTTTTTTTTGEPVLPDGKTTVGSVPFTADAASQRDAAAYADAGSGLNATGNKMAMMDGASPLLGEGASRDGDEAPQHGEQELSFTVGTIRSTEGDAADGAIQEKTVEEICRECNDRVEEALECGGDAVLCRTLLTVTRRLVDLDQGSKALTSRTYYNRK